MQDQRAPVGDMPSPHAAVRDVPDESIRLAVPDNSEQRTARMIALRECLRSTPDALVAERFRSTRRHLFLDALACDDWPCAFHVGLALRAHGESDMSDACHIALAAWRIGETAAAADILRQVLLCEPHHREAVSLSAALHAWYASCDLSGGLIDDGELRLQALGHHHIDDFRWHYDDPAMIDLCCLPDFEDDADWHAWLDEIHEAGDQALFGLWHRYWGFVGCVSLIMHAGLGLYYYWIGRDFRGLGFGPRAGRLLLEQAQAAWGMRACYAKVYAHNAPSLRGLSKIGFQPTGVPIMRPGQAPEHLLRWPEACGDVGEEAWSFLKHVDRATHVLSVHARSDVSALVGSMASIPATQLASESLPGSIL
ncbi:hypothetical protein LF63_0108075 [Oleiagrimonas soli]|uniref:N-acetyltransferase domain-containing protein n=2 Tax=Oleiagrimonas soli TaxID=1543381 RepID=A0A099CWB0_9GAMM|nr:hypothetical protein LF63_0108075 [Oleiagrimonas soli]